MPDAIILAGFSNEEDQTKKAINETMDVGVKSLPTLKLFLQFAIYDSAPSGWLKSLVNVNRWHFMLSSCGDGGIHSKLFQSPFA